MLKALNQNSGEAIVILNAQWRERIAELRKLDAADSLACPGCRQPVRIKAGKIRRWHFAHKHLANCPFERESPLLIATRATLYEWLVSQFGEAEVEVEMVLEGLKRPVDLAVRLPDRATDPGGGARLTVYWIIETRMPPEERDQLRQAIEKRGARSEWIFTASMLRLVQPDAEALRLEHPGSKPVRKMTQLTLSTTEREFMTPSAYDEVLNQAALSPGKTLHYLEAAHHPANAQLTTFRNLHLIHPPQRYTGLQLTQALSAIHANRQTGALVHPGEDEKLEDYLTLRSRRESKQARVLPGLTGKAAAFPIPRASESSGGQAASRQPFSRSGICRQCGKLTEDWVSFDGKTGLCLCRDCAQNSASD